MDKIEEQKRRAGERAAEFVENGMIVGLGTGSTVNWTICRLGELLKDGLDIRGVPTSISTEKLAVELGIPLTDFSEIGTVDLTIDGADEIDQSLDLIKGGGGALLREKLVAAASKSLIIVADESKIVRVLGAFRVPVEIVPFAWETTSRRIAGLGYAPSLRTIDGQPQLSDNSNYIVDCDCGEIDDPAKLHAQLKDLTGVVETGLFEIGRASCRERV